jgi:hypothetical protein
MPKTQPITDLPDLSHLPEDLREFIRGMAEDGIRVTPANRPPGYRFPEPIRANTSLSDAIIEERNEGGR